MDIVRTFDDAVSFFAAYPTWVKLFGTGWFVVGVVWIATLVLTPKVEPVERWLLASDEATIKAFVPGDLFQDWKTKNEIANDLIRQRERRAADQLGVGENPPSSPSTLDSTFLLKAQKAENDRNASQHRIEEYIRLVCCSRVRFSPKGFHMKLVQTRTSPRIYGPRSGKI
jgi:hypothetical protein